ncbi:type II toxin-antitoxin system VapC family toxin [Brevibacterium aurantiacum]|uniref:VapC toxin family PIN domain ribonuclease n=1 Tax=Brevibacterium aurantiacum TaxID=273384 RepID=A0A2A3ZLC3_BREAU|nr:type II toxin-antitoxin system VapC family toxin [Brevibacterium aurantiacum]PCC52338.1 VapC toxin family PIN domain ribonuclease [Brevibacterium aurantiacum]
MNFLLDTNTVSALRIRGRNPEVEKWSESVPLTAQFISAPTVAEIERGVLAKERQDSRQGLNIRGWFEERLLPGFAGRILTFDLSAARVLGSFRVPEHAPLDDALIASIAVANNMTVATHNTRHFEPLDGVRLVNPWDSH